MAEEVKKFYRSRDNRILFGVCGGLGKYFSVDPILFRLFFLLLQFTNGAGILVYILMVFIIPLEPGQAGEEGQPDLRSEAEELKDKIDLKAQELSREFRSETRTEQEVQETKKSYSLLGVIIVLFGVFFLLREMFPMPWVSNNFLGALAIIAIGLLIMFRK